MLLNLLTELKGPISVGLFERLLYVGYTAKMAALKTQEEEE